MHLCVVLYAVFRELKRLTLKALVVISLESLASHKVVACLEPGSDQLVLSRLSEATQHGACRLVHILDSLGRMNRIGIYHPALLAIGTLKPRMRMLFQS